MKNKFTRDIQVEAASIEEDVLTFSVASAEPYERNDERHGTYYEVLTISEEAIDFSRLVDQRCPFLFEHDTSKQLGVVEKAYIADGKLYVAVRFSSGFEAQEVLADIKSGIRRNTSIRLLGR